MKMSLNLKDYIKEMDELAPGETMRVNHESCEAGEDTRQRLYLPRTQADESKVIGYCHNCQQGGAWSTTSYLAFRNDKHKGATHVNVLSDECHPPVGRIPQVSAWPSAAQSWLYSNGLGQADVDTYGIAYDPTTDRVYLPRWDVVRAGSTSDSTLAGYQLRALHGYHRPKYLTGQRKDAKNYTIIAGRSKQNITEMKLILF